MMTICILCYLSYGDGAESLLRVVCDITMKIQAFLTTHNICAQVKLQTHRALILILSNDDCFTTGSVQPPD